MVTTLLDVLGTLLIIAALAVFGAVAVGGPFAVAIGLTISGVLVLVFSWAMVKGGGR
jgi:hypothetical protein